MISDVKRIKNEFSLIDKQLCNQIRDVKKNDKPKFLKDVELNNLCLQRKENRKAQTLAIVLHMFFGSEDSLEEQSTEAVKKTMNTAMKVMSGGVLSPITEHDIFTEYTSQFKVCKRYPSLVSYDITAVDIEGNDKVKTLYFDTRATKVLYNNSYMLKDSAHTASNDGIVGECHRANELISQAVAVLDSDIHPITLPYIPNTKPIYYSVDVIKTDATDVYIKLRFVTKDLEEQPDSIIKEKSCYHVYYDNNNCLITEPISVQKFTYFTRKADIAKN